MPRDAYGDAPRSPHFEIPASARTASAHAAQQSFADAINQFATLSTALPAATDEILSVGKLKPLDHIDVHADGTYGGARAYIDAVAAIGQTSSTLGGAPADTAADVIRVPGGFFQHFPDYDIYVTPDGVFEVHGDIRAKYNALGGASGLLGVPETNEQGTPDGNGRFNHFKGGSIYWTPRTGPMSVRATVRDLWASTGWELGPLGYPVQDQRRMVPEHYLTDPVVEWCRFENGVIAGDAKGAAVAPAAVVTYAELGAIFGARLNAQFMASPDNVAMRPGMDLTGVTDWGYNFWSSIPRSIAFRFRGFHDNGGFFSDTDFTINIALSFGLAWQPMLWEGPTRRFSPRSSSFGSFMTPGRPSLAAMWLRA
jgi:hypothetical protein